MAKRRRQALLTITAQHGERADATYYRLRNLIVRGLLKPGSRVLEAELALALGVSRTPVREALDRLSREGYLEVTSVGRRAELAVTPLREEDVRELWALTGALEGLSILAVSGMGRDQRRQLASAMAQVNDELRRQTARRPLDVDVVGSLMTEFHQVFMDACAGRQLAAVYETVRPRVQRYEWAYSTWPEASYRTSLADHSLIVAAVGRGDGEEARMLLERHWRDGVERTVKLLRIRAR